MYFLEDKLCYLVALFNDVRSVTLVDKANGDVPTIVGVDDAGYYMDVFVKGKAAA